jgi:GTPase SAR1 family protein
VAVGDQSSGKSSILESLTGFSFPQAPGLCTRYATQISCRREPRSKVLVSIIPRPNADAKLINRIRSFRRTIPALAKDGLVEIIADASRIMGIKMVPEDADPSLQAFSHDVLKVEINGPDQEHFMVIDVPGIFRYPSPPLTTESDVSLVQDMVESHIRNNRIIILAVLPSNVHISTQEILQMAKTADPYGCSTMGVLTKPDLVTENTSRDIIKDLVSGERNQLRLGYFVVKSRSADDQSLEFSDCLLQEAKFFNDDAWRSVASSGRCGIEPLKARLRDLLTTITKREFPNVIADVAKREKQCQNDLISIGPSRETVAAQRIFLGRIGSRFQAITQRALNGYYEGEHIFDEDPSLKLITNITKLNERFANDMCNQGHKRQVFTSHNNEEGSIYALSDHEMPHNTYNAPLSKYHELQHIVVEGDYKGSNTKPLANDSITDHIKQVYQDNRGPNLGTVRTILNVNHY